MQNKTIRFIIITTPPEQISRELTGLIEKLADIGKTKAARQYPPHITLRTGVLVPEPELNFFFKDFKKVTDELSAFHIETKGIDIITYNDNGAVRYLVYYRIKENPELRHTNKRLLTYSLYKKSNKTGFHPHLSLAYKDIDESGLNRIKSYLKYNNHRRDYSWLCDNIGFYYENSGKWQPYHVFTLKDQGN